MTTKCPNAIELCFGRYFTWGKVKTLFDENFSYKRMKANYGNAVRLNPALNTPGRTERIRQVVQDDGGAEEALCTPEDVTLGPERTHEVGTLICLGCNIPICNE